MDDLNFTLTDYIGSAYNPQVSITVTDEGHVVSITYMSPSGLDTVSYTVPDWSDEEQARADAEAQRLQAEADRVIAENNRVAAEQARVAAESARVAAEQGRMDAEASRVAAEQARVAAEQSRVSAETARQQASQTAVANANAAAAAANTAASNADDKAQAAQAAAVDASSAASAAASAATNAATAATAANTAATSAADAAGAAGAAASAATSAASEATDAADSANAAADRADAAAESIEDELAQKADKDGYYSQMTVGLAENLVGRGDPVGAEYLYRTSGGTQSIEDGDAEVTEIRGNTLKWNQLAPYLNASNYRNEGPSGSTEFGDGTARLSFTVDDVRQIYTTRIQDRSYAAKGISGHKVLVAATVKPSKDMYSNLYLYGKTADGTVTGKSMFSEKNRVDSGVARRIYNIFDMSEKPDVVSAAVAVTISGDSVRTVLTGDYADISDILIVDLTAAYGAGNEPSTLSEFEASFPLPYYPYDLGSLLSVNMKGIETVGFNLLDCHDIFERTTSTYSNSLGQANTARFLATLKELKKLNQTMYWHITRSTTESGSSTPVGMIMLFNRNGNILKRIYPNNTFLLSNIDLDTVYNAVFYGSTTATVVFTEACINISWSGYRNGEYEPYQKYQRAIDTSQWFPNGMHAINDVHDSLTENAAEHRIGSVDLGTLNYYAASTDTAGTYRMRAPFPAAKSVPNNQIGNLYCLIYDAETANKTYQRNEGVSVELNGEISIYDPNYNTQESVAAFKEAMSGVTLLYELVTPTTEEIDPPLNLTYKVSDFGTERIMVDETAQAPQSAPVPMSVVYAANASDTVRRLPVDYISEKSFENFRSALASALGLTITEEFDTDQGNYVYTVEQTQTTEGE